MVKIEDSWRIATLVLVDPTNELLGTLPPVTLSSPWYQEISELISLVREEHNITPLILRLIDVDDSQLPQIKVSYLAQIDGESTKDLLLSPWTGQLDEQPLRLAYAKAGGPAHYCIPYPNSSLTIYSIYRQPTLLSFPGSRRIFHPGSQSLMPAAFLRPWYMVTIIPVIGEVPGWI